MIAFCVADTEEEEEEDDANDDEEEEEEEDEEKNEHVFMSKREVVEAGTECAMLSYSEGCIEILHTLEFGAKTLELFLMMKLT